MTYVIPPHRREQIIAEETLRVKTRRNLDPRVRTRRVLMVVLVLYVFCMLAMAFFGDFFGRKPAAKQRGTIAPRRPPPGRRPATRSAPANSSGDPLLHAIK